MTTKADTIISVSPTAPALSGALNSVSGGGLGEMFKAPSDPILKSWTFWIGNISNPSNPRISSTIDST
jgi:hypothetical protein